MKPQDVDAQLKPLKARKNTVQNLLPTMIRHKSEFSLDKTATVNYLSGF
jgi:hypothetical protein